MEIILVLKVSNIHLYPKIKSKKAIQDYTFKAFETLEKMDIEAEKKAILKAFGENLMGRNV